MGTVTCIPGIKNITRVSGDDKTSPEGLIAVPQSAHRKVLRGNQGYRYVGRHTDRLPPIKLIHGGDACTLDEVEIAKGHDSARCSLFRETLQGRKIKVIIMIVGHQHNINRGQMFKTDAGPKVPFGTHPWYRAATVRPNWIGENVKTIHLNKESGVTDRGHTDHAFRDKGDRTRSRRNILYFRPFWPIIAQNPVPNPPGAATPWH